MIEVIIAFLAGLLIGSFLNVCVFRLPQDLSVVRPRSFCPNCQRTIAWYDNLPIASFLLLRGRCRHCQARIPVRYPLIELATAVAFAACVAVLGVTLPALKYCLFAAILIALIATDLEARILPDEFTLGGAAIGLILAAFVPVDPGIVSLLLPSSLGPRWLSLAEAASSAALAGGGLWLIMRLYEKIRHREGMGLGDVKMLAMIGAFLGFRLSLMTMIVGSLLGSLVGGLYIFITEEDSTYPLPFGSFLGAAALAVAGWSLR